MAANDFTPEEETRAFAIAALGIALGVTHVLKARGIISTHDVSAIFDGNLQGLENNFPPDDRAIQAARLLLDQLASFVSASPPSGLSR